jgi:hypothetical protein
VLTAIADEGWLFDTELLHLAQRRRLTILEVPVRWVDYPDSRVAIVATAVEDLKGTSRLRRGAPWPPATSRPTAGPRADEGTPMSKPSIRAPGRARRDLAPALAGRAHAALRLTVRGRDDEPAWSRPLLWLVGLL